MTTGSDRRTQAQVSRVLGAPRLEGFPDPSSSIEEQAQLLFHLRAFLNHGLPNMPLAVVV
ncbi:hypothetical protein ABT299_51495 [Spirillospora sp. NPDC000708]|uniref:hypothetical protein n=1 Tax=Actinomadura nitritigenes TaxID=134602 RepID=UPI00335CEBB7